MKAVRTLYERLPYPPPLAEVDGFRDHRQTYDGSPKYYFPLFWPRRTPTDDLDILVAGCGTSQAVKVAVQQPAARVVGIDISGPSLDATRELAARYALSNLELHRVEIERVAELDRTFDFILSTGVLHHLPDPDVGLRALADVLRPDGAMHLMVYATYGRAGVYMMQSYCDRLGITADAADLRGLAEVVASLPETHPLRHFSRRADDLRTAAGLADTLLHPQDRSYTVPQVFDWLDRAGLRHMRWFFGASYDPRCGRPATGPHAARLAALSTSEASAAVELLRGTMITHTFAACRQDRSARDTQLDLTSPVWPTFVPTVLAGARADREGDGLVLHHPGHGEGDLVLRLTPEESHVYTLIDGVRSLDVITDAVAMGAERVRGLFQRLVAYDQMLLHAPAS